MLRFWAKKGEENVDKHGNSYSNVKVPKRFSIPDIFIRLLINFYDFYDRHFYTTREQQFSLSENKFHYSERSKIGSIVSTERSCSGNKIHSNVSITDRDELVWKVGDPYTPGSVERMLSRRCYRSRYLLACEPSDRSRLMARSVMNVAARATAITASWYHKSWLPCALGHLRAAFISFIRACAYVASVRIIINTGVYETYMSAYSSPCFFDVVR